MLFAPLISYPALLWTAWAARTSSPWVTTFLAHTAKELSAYRDRGLVSAFGFRLRLAAANR